MRPNKEILSTSSKISTLCRDDMGHQISTYLSIQCFSFANLEVMICSSKKCNFQLQIEIKDYIIKIKHHLPCWRTKEFLCKNIDQKCYMSPWNVTCPEMLTGKNQDCSLKLWQNKCILYALNSVICSPLQDSRLASSRANEVIFAIMHTYVFPSRYRN